MYILVKKLKIFSKPLLYIIAMHLVTMITSSELCGQTFVHVKCNCVVYFMFTLDIIQNVPVSPREELGEQD